MISLEEALTKLKEGKRLELKFYLAGGLFSRHELSLDNGMIVDFSYVDDSTTMTTIKEYKRGFYGRAFKKQHVQLEEEYS
ncbi:MAG: hypothetical protein EPO24_13605 [Bacteroidetes bacterium]|nr:MAG: hypothetical protein EPO24_13605 [Bacteroidota bacterium]